VRGFVAEGATVITDDRNRNFYTRVVLAPQPRALQPDRLSQRPFAPTGPGTLELQTFTDHYTVSDGNQIIELYHVEEAKVTSHGPSGIGFVNFGAINQLDVQAPIETFGQGARGFNVYAGTVGSAEFDRIVTHADGAVGLQISQPVGMIVVKRGVETFGRAGDSLVKGVVVRLSPIAFSIKPGGVVERAEIRGGLITHGPGIEALELHGRMRELIVQGGLASASGGFEAI
jgi:hypothetical protein